MHRSAKSHETPYPYAIRLGTDEIGIQSGPQESSKHIGDPIMPLSTMNEVAERRVIGDEEWTTQSRYRTESTADGWDIVAGRAMAR
jgi:hypothetical protein